MAMTTLSTCASSMTCGCRLIVDGWNKMGLKCFEPEGAFYVFPSVKSTGLTSMEFCERLIHSKRVAVVPGDASAPAARLRAHFLLLLHPHIIEALERMERSSRSCNDWGEGVAVPVRRLPSEELLRRWRRLSPPWACGKR